MVLCFRLLTEYHSFLLKMISKSIRFVYCKKSFRLLTEYHSFLYKIELYNSLFRVKTFPSPYGVSFILIMIIAGVIAYRAMTSFRLLTEYHSFLYDNNKFT